MTEAGGTREVVMPQAPSPVSTMDGMRGGGDGSAMLCPRWNFGGTRCSSDEHSGLSCLEKSSVRAEAGGIAGISEPTQLDK